MTRTYLVRGMLVGLLASFVAFGFARTVGEPQIEKAEAFERQVAQERGEPEEHAVVSRDIQDTVGLGAGLILTGTALGGLFALGFAFVYRRFTLRSAGVTAALMAAIGFTVVYVVPFLKYPANPPSVGDPDTIGRRTTLYLLMVLLSLVLSVIAALLRDRLLVRLSRWDATIVAIAFFCIAIAVAYIATPGIDEVPVGFPSAVLWRFRIATLGIQGLLWMTIGLAFGALTERAEERQQITPEPRAHAPLLQ